MTTEMTPEQPLPDGVPPGSELRGQIVVSYFVMPNDEPLINTSIHHGPSFETIPTYFEAVGMMKRAESSIEQIYSGRQDS